nr:hypothetical protein [Tanacetum cinerariifolium]
MNVEVEQDDLNQKFLTSLAPEWLMHTILWRNRNDLDTMSLDDLCNHLKVYESEVQKKSDPNSQNMAFISSSKHSSENEDGNTACVSTASTNVPTASASVATISQDTASAYIASQSNKFWKKTRKKISIQGSDVAGFDKSKVECFNYHKMGHFARECRAPISQERGRKDNYRQGSKNEEKTPKALMAIDGVGWDWSYMANEGEDYALVADEEAPTEFALMANTESKVFDNSLCSKDCKKNNDSLKSKITDLTNELSKANKYIYHYKLVVAQLEGRLVEYKEREVKYIEKIRTLEFYRESNKERIESLSKQLETLKLEKDGVDGKLAGLLKASKNLDNLVESQRSDKIKDGVGYCVVLPPIVDLYLSPKKDLSWTGLPEFADDTVTDYSRPSPTVESTSEEGQNRNSSTSEDVASPITPKSFVKFVKSKDFQSKSKTNKKETPKKPQVKYTEQYKQSNKKPNVRGNQRNWNNLKSYQLGPEFVLKKKACFNCGDFTHLANNCRKRVKGGTTRNNSPVNRNFSTGRRNFPTANRKFPTASRKFPTDSTKIHTADMGRKEKAVKSSTCWFWKPSHNLSNKGPNNNSVSVMLKKYTYIDIQGILKTKDETSRILKKFINEIENLKDLKVKIIRCDNGGEFRNKEMNDFCSRKGIKREFSNARTPQQNGVAKRRNRTLIEEARTMLADAKLLVTFWAKAVNTVCYVQNRVLVNKSQNKTPYELFNGRTPTIGFLKPFGCHVMILNTLDHLGKFEAKGDEGYFIGYSMFSKAFRVFNKRTRRVEENLHVEFLENKAIEKGAGPNWLYDIDSLTKSMNYVPVDACTNSTFQVQRMQQIKNKPQDGCSPEVPEGSRNINPTASTTNPPADQMETLTVETSIPTVSSPVPTACLNDSPEPSNILRVESSPDEAIKVEADVNNMETTITATPTPTLRIHKDHPKSQIIGPMDTPIQIRHKSKEVEEQNPSWVEAMQEELLQFKIQNVWTLVYCPKGVRPIGTKWVLKNKKDERGIVVRNKARLVAQVYQMDVKSAFFYGTTDEEVYVMQPLGFQDLEFSAKVYKVEKALYGLHQAPRAWYGTLSKYLLMNGFQRGTIDQTLFIRRQRGDFILFQVYVDDIISGSSNLQLCREFEAFMHKKFQMSAMGDILKKFRYSDVRSSNTPMDKENPWRKDEAGKDVDIHLYRSMIGSLLYLTASRPDIMFAICACARISIHFDSFRF